MKLVRHPCVVRLYEVKFFDSLLFKFLAGRTNIYILLEYNTCGELFIELFVMNVFVKQKLGSTYTSLPKELIPEKLLLHSQGNLKISDYGLSALQERGVTILKTTCGTPNF
ncbi:unnamed protein product [Brassica oleracea var. botrytis]